MAKNDSTPKTQDKPAAPRHIDIVAKVITEQFGGKGKLTDVAAYIAEHKLLPKLGAYPYRTIYGIVLRDKGKTLQKTAKGVFKVKPAPKSSAK